MRSFLLAMVFVWSAGSDAKQLSCAELFRPPALTFLATSSATLEKGFSIQIDHEVMIDFVLSPGHEPFVTMSWNGKTRSDVQDAFLLLQPIGWTGSLVNQDATDDQENKTILNIELAELQNKNAQRLISNLISATTANTNLQTRAPEIVAMLATALTLISR